MFGYRITTLIFPHSMAAILICESNSAQDWEKSGNIDMKSVKKWPAPFRGWHYYHEHVIPACPDIDGFKIDFY